MIHLAMLRLICSDIQQQVPHATAPLGHIPVADGDDGGLGGRPEGQFASVEIGDGARVGDDGFFFEVADEAVAGAQGEEVCEEEAIEEDALSAEDHGAHEEARGVRFQEGEEVHALVEGFFEEGFNPGVEG